jgi:hypothetical protein
LIIVKEKLKRRTNNNMKRYQKWNDLFTVTCRKCGNTDVDLCADFCEGCGSSVKVTCNKCGIVYDYHDFVFGDFEDR